MASSEFVVDQRWTSNTAGPLRWIWSHIRRNPLLITMIFVGGAGNAGLAAALPVLTGIGFDAVVGEEGPNLRLLLTMALLMVGSQLLRSLLQLGRNFGSEVLGQRLERDARQELYASLLGKSMGFHDLHATGDLMARATNDVRELALMMAPGFNLVIGSLNFLIIPLIIAPTIHPSLIWTPIGFAATYVVAMYFYLRELSPVTTNVRSSFGLLNAGLTESIEGIETVKGAAQEENEVGRFRKNARRFRNAFVTQGRVEGRFLPLLLLLALPRARPFGTRSPSTRRARFPSAMSSPIWGLIQLFGFPVFVSIFAYSQASSGISSARRILELIRSETQLDVNEVGAQQTMRGDVRFDNVTFFYDIVGEDEAGEDEAGKDEGEEGAAEPGGAAPLAGGRVVFRCAGADAGARGADRGRARAPSASCSTAPTTPRAGACWWMASTCASGTWPRCANKSRLSSRDIFLFSRTIAENISFGKPDATEAEIEAAARAAQAHDFISSFPGRL